MENIRQIVAYWYKGILSVTKYKLCNINSMADLYTFWKEEIELKVKHGFRLNLIK